MYTNKPSLIPSRQRGITLVELIVGMVIVSVAITGMALAMQASVRNSADPMLSKQKLAIAESLMEEVTRQPFTYCDPDNAIALSATSTADCAPGAAAAETRGGAVSPFDNVADYNNLTLATITDATNSAITITDASGTSVAALPGYSATISVVPTDVGNGIPLTEALRINVTVTAPDGSTLTLTSYRLRHSPNSL